MTEISVKAGMRLKSAVCDTQIMILRVPAASLALTCGGAAMLAMNETPADGVAADPAHMQGTQTGKRYVDADETLEFLCTKGGAGGLAVGGVALQIKQAKALPSSD